jgi:hypothetical protein
VQLDRSGSGNVGSNAGDQALERRDHGIAVLGYVGHLGSEIRSGNSLQAFELGKWNVRPQ